MTNKFLRQSKGLTLSKLQNGTADLNFNSLTIGGSAVGSGGEDRVTTLETKTGNQTADENDTTFTGKVISEATQTNNIYDSSMTSTISLSSSEINLDADNVLVNGSPIGGGGVGVKRLRITKTPDRAPTPGNAVYEDEFIRLGWDQATASDLEIQRTPASPAYLSFCFRTATIAEQEVFVANADQTYTLNNFGFNGGEIMECRLTPFESSTAPAYHISIHFTKSSTGITGIDGDLDWIITRYNIST